MRQPLVCLLFAASLLCGCRGRLVGKAELFAPGSAEATFQKGPRDVVLWGNVEGKWKGGKNSKLPIVWDVDVEQGGTLLGRVTCDTEESAGVAIWGSHSNIFGEHSGDCEVKLACKLPRLKMGAVVLRVTGRKKLPERIVSIAEMSIFVRED